MRIRAVVTDLDSTIVGEDRAVSPATLRATDELREQGIAVVAATARSTIGLSMIEALAGKLTLAVCSGGSLGWSATRGELWREMFGAATAGQVVDFVTRHLPGAGVSAFNGQDWRMTQAYWELRGQTRFGPVDTVPVSAVAGDDVISMSICHATASSDELAAALAAAGIKQAPTVTYSTHNMLDVYPGGVDKGSGVAHALDLLGVAPADAAAFGDMPNDLPMLQLCGYGVAVGNAHPEVLAAAGLVTRCIHNDGFARQLAAWGLVTGGSFAEADCACERAQTRS